MQKFHASPVMVPGSIMFKAQTPQAVSLTRHRTVPLPRRKSPHRCASLRDSTRRRGRFHAMSQRPSCGRPPARKSPFAEPPGLGALAPSDSAVASSPVPHVILRRPRGYKEGPFLQLRSDTKKSQGPSHPHISNESQSFGRGCQASTTRKRPALGMAEPQMRAQITPPPPANLLVSTRPWSPSQTLSTT